MENTKKANPISIDKDNLKKYYIAVCLIPGTLLFFLGPLYLIFMGWLHLPYWLTNYSVAVTDSQIIINSGVLFKKRKVIPFSKITDFTLKQGPLMSLCGIKNICIQTAGQGTTTPETTLQAVVNPDEILDRLVLLHENLNQS